MAGSKAAENGHVALYRKYRPQTFRDVRNQDQVVSVLEGALKKGTIPHALLFTGSRGTGKTTVARIFAHEVGASDVDIYEIDAASNRGIDDIRELREAVHAMPYQSPYKVYIIDEVHMLTKEAFNALLKTLEEPPSHVIFILATTEVEKLLDTILSRCQVFHFRAPSRTEVRELVLAVAKKEKVTIASDAADLIAVAADGSFRDALGITQKVITASSDTKIEADEVAHIIGAPKGELIIQLLEALNTSDTQRALTAVKAAVEENADMKLFAKLLLERVRAVILARYNTQNRADVLSMYAAEDAKTLEQFADEASSNINSHLLRGLLEATSGPTRTFLSQLPLELAIIEATQPSKE